jgi:periplasmic divalent cation tolerance protein
VQNRSRSTKPKPKPLLVITSVPDHAAAVKLAERLVDERLAACVNVMAGCTSVYRWQGKSEASAEVPLFIKTVEERYDRLEELVRSMHPYELPEIIAVPVQNGLAGYLKWLSDETRSSDKN